MPTYACVQTDRHEGGLEEVVWEEVPAQVQEAVQDTHPALLRRTWPWHRLYMYRETGTQDFSGLFSHNKSLWLQENKTGVACLQLYTMPKNNLNLA